jgi:hypothetical protein
MRQILKLNNKIIKIAGSIVYIVLGSFIIYDNDNNLLLADDDSYLVWE